MDASVDQKAVPIHDHKLTIKGNKTIELHPDRLATGQLTSHELNSPHYFLDHTPIGLRYPEKGYDDFFVFDQTSEQVHCPRLPDLCPLILFDTTDRELFYGG